MTELKKEIFVLIIMYCFIFTNCFNVKKNNMNSKYEYEEKSMQPINSEVFSETENADLDEFDDQYISDNEYYNSKPKYKLNVPKLKLNSIASETSVNNNLEDVFIELNHKNNPNYYNNQSNNNSNSLVSNENKKVTFLRKTSTCSTESLLKRRSYTIDDMDDNISIISNNTYIKRHHYKNSSSLLSSHCALIQRNSLKKSNSLPDLKKFDLLNNKSSYSKICDTLKKAGIKDDTFLRVRRKMNKEEKTLKNEKDNISVILNSDISDSEISIPAYKNKNLRNKSIDITQRNRNFERINKKMDSLYNRESTASAISKLDNSERKNLNKNKSLFPSNNYINKTTNYINKTTKRYQNKRNETPIPIPTPTYRLTKMEKNFEILKNSVLQISSKIDNLQSPLSTDYKADNKNKKISIEIGLESFFNDFNNEKNQEEIIKLKNKINFYKKELEFQKKEKGIALYENKNLKIERDKNYKTNQNLNEKYLKYKSKCQKLSMQNKHLQKQSFVDQNIEAMRQEMDYMLKSQISENKLNSEVNITPNQDNSKQLFEENYLLKKHNNILKKQNENFKSFNKKRWYYKIKKYTTISYHIQKILSLSFNCDSEILISGGIDKKIGIWDIETGDLNNVNSILYTDSEICSLDFNPIKSNIFISGELNKTVNIWDINKPTDKINLASSKSNDAIISTRYSLDGNMIGINYKRGYIELWDQRSSKLIKTFTNQNGFYTKLCFGNSGNFIASGSPKSISIYDIKTLKLYKTIIEKNNNSCIYAIDYTKYKNYLISVSLDNLVKIRDLNNFKVVRYFYKDEGLSNKIVLSPDGETIAIPCQNRRVEIYNTFESKDPLKNSFKAHKKSVLNLKFSPCNYYMATCSEGKNDNLRIWATTNEFEYKND
ncbi:MAG: hypothetical protein GY830_10035 [Bacteroidetes bacterium]|nr:hypothetical protein [Bacteroidota bacterium]